MMNIHKVKLKYISAPVAFVAFLLVTVLAGSKLHAQPKPSAGKNVKQKPAKKDTATITDTTIKFALNQQHTSERQQQYQPGSKKRHACYYN